MFTNTLHNPSELPKNDHDRFADLFKAIEGLLTEFLLHQRRAAPCERGQIALDLSRDCFVRPNQTPGSLDRNLTVRMLEELARNSWIDIVDFLLLERATPCGGYGDVRRMEKAFRRQQTYIRRLIKRLDLAVVIECHAHSVRAVFDPARTRTNVFDARRLAGHAVSQLRTREFRGAARTAEQALAVDFDCMWAARVIRRIHLVNDDHLTPSAILRARFCVARLLIRHARAIRRLPERSCNSAVVEARRRVQQSMKRFDRHWRDLLSYRFNSPSSDANTKDQQEVTYFLDTAVKASRGEPDAFSALSQVSLIRAVATELLNRRTDGERPPDFKGIVDDLSPEIVETIIIKPWTPTPALSRCEVEQHLVDFLARTDLNALPLRGKRKGGLEEEFETEDRNDAGPVIRMKRRNSHRPRRRSSE